MGRVERQKRSGSYALSSVCPLVISAMGKKSGRYPNDESPGRWRLAINFFSRLIQKVFNATIDFMTPYGILWRQHAHAMTARFKRTGFVLKRLSLADCPVTPALRLPVRKSAAFLGPVFFKGAGDFMYGRRSDAAPYSHHLAEGSGYNSPENKVFFRVF